MRLSPAIFIWFVFAQFSSDYAKSVVLKSYISITFLTKYPIINMLITCQICLSAVIYTEQVYSGYLLRVNFEQTVDDELS